MEAEGMAEQRCPMCGRPNPREAVECQHCGARLSPLELGGGPQPPGDDLGAGGASVGEDWLASMRAGSDEGDDAESEPIAGAELPSWLGDAGGAEATEESGKLGEQVEPFDASRGGEQEQQDAAPEWLRRIRAKEEARQGDQADLEWASRLRGIGESTPAEQPPVQALREEVSPAEMLEEPELELPAEDEPDLAPSWGRGAPASGEPGGPPSWLSGLDSGLEAEPAEESGEEGAQAAGLPHVPALILPEDGLSPRGTADGDVELPEWLGAITPEQEQQQLPAAEGGEARLAPATLPSWLEAMRPVETFRSVVQIQSEDDQAVESAGPLAGLRGVLIAEPLVAMPRTATVGSMQLAVSERQYAQAELLHRMVEEEQREVHVSRRPRPQLNLIRWAIAAVMLVATALPVLTGSPRFPPPSLEPRELGSLFTLIDTLPAERPALLVFDYEPGYSGELEAVGEPLIVQLMARGVPIATMTTRPTGSPLATRTIGRLAERHGYTLGEEVVHLGYLSGGPTAIQLFSLGPRAAILQGFAMPAELREAGISAWDTPVLRGVNQLADFSVVAVITAGTETARAWAEQAKGNMGDTPLVMILSAGAEPMVRPYYEARAPRVNGILTGLPAATAYERRIGQEGLSAQRWNAFGSAMLAGELILLAGVGFGLVQWWMARQQK